MARPTNIATVFLLFQLSTTAYSIGINYGTLGDNLPPPSVVANFLKTRTTFDRVKIFNVNPEIIQAFANTGIFLAVTAPNADIIPLKDTNFARRWVVDKIKPFHPQTKINYIFVGNEVIHWGSDDMILSLATAMRTLHNALIVEGIADIKVTTAHSLEIIGSASPPSDSRFKPDLVEHILGPILTYLREIKAPFMVNPYPYFGYDPKNADFALFRPNRGLFDWNTKLTYTNQFDALLDAVYSAMKAIGFADVNIAVGETGWPTNCDGKEACSMANAEHYNRQLVRHVEAGKGTPLMPNRQFESYIFALFNENQKPGPTAERNWGLFQPDLTPVYDCGILRNAQVEPVAGHKWCVPKPEASEQALQANIDYACGQGIDCRPIQPGGACFEPNNIRAVATYAMNTFYQTKGGQDFQCDFSQSGVLTAIDPSHDNCRM